MFFAIIGSSSFYPIFSRFSISCFKRLLFIISSSFSSKILFIAFRFSSNFGFSNSSSKVGFSKLLDEPIDQENFIDIMCKNYLDDQIVTKLHKTNLVKKKLDIEVINQFIIKPQIIEKEDKIN